MRRTMILFALLSAGWPAVLDAIQLTPSHTAAVSPVPTTISDFFLPGSQPGQSGSLESPRSATIATAGTTNRWSRRTTGVGA